MESSRALESWVTEVHQEVDSTQEVLAKCEADQPRGRRVVVATRQRHGRGRSHRRWESPAGGLWCSLSLLVAADPDPFLGLLAALAARDAVESLLPSGGARLTLKWPNDL
ncbi:MAG: biotin--[acetyl-CoA-carboxylase] ligase, partial [Planctomycetota bacterium]